MDEMTLRRQVAETGRLLLEYGLVARTWGNFSARTDETHFLITPSGLGYEQMQPDDVVRFCMTDETGEGKRKPSSEIGIHIEAYRLFDDAAFVIHTHQPCATALGLSPPDRLAVSEEERRSLGGIAWADYGLPGTKKLKDAVARALRTGAHTVLMKHHGALICGESREETVRRALLLEDLCRRSLCRDVPVPAAEDAGALLSRLRKSFPEADAEQGEATGAWSSLRLPLRAQLDDAAQMIGPRIPCADSEDTLAALLRKHPAVFVPGIGAVVCGEDASDTAALKVLTDKAALAALHTRALHLRADLSLSDCLLMRSVYRLKYAKMKRG